MSEFNEQLVKEHTKEYGKVLVFLMILLGDAQVLLQQIWIINVKTLKGQYLYILSLR